jgi:transcriptional regulator with XRE-family HTH domain
MIKNDVQLKRVKERIEQLHEEIRKLQEIYTGAELDFWSSAIKDEEKQLEDEQIEYGLLKALSFEDAVKNVLQEPELFENIGELLAKLRIAAKLTQGDMADRLGWQQANVSRFENENYSSQTVKKISEYLGALGVWLYVTPSLNEKRIKIDIDRNPALFDIGKTVSLQGSLPLNTFNDTTTSSGNTTNTLAIQGAVGSIYQHLFSKVNTKASSSLIHS